MLDIRGPVVDVALLIAVGITPEGHRTVLGVSVSDSEAEVHWREFFKGLLARGLHGCRYIVSDDHAGLEKARTACFAGVPWQRCQFHLMQNAMAYVPNEAMQDEVTADLRDIFDAPDRAEADRRITTAVNKYTKTASKLADWMENNVPESLTVFCLPARQSRPYANQQHARTPEPRAETPHPCGQYLPKRRLPATLGQRGPDGGRRRLDGRTKIPYHGD